MVSCFSCFATIYMQNTPNARLIVSFNPLFIIIYLHSLDILSNLMLPQGAHISLYIVEYVNDVSSCRKEVHIISMGSAPSRSQKLYQVFSSWLPKHDCFAESDTKSDQDQRNQHNAYRCSQKCAIVIIQESCLSFMTLMWSSFPLFKPKKPNTWMSTKEVLRKNDRHMDQSKV